MKKIVLSTLNARYAHASFGLRYLRANLGPYKDQSVLKEFTTKRRPEEMVEEILREEPALVGFGVYIWNTDQTLEVVKLLKEKRPDLLVVVGGPEVSFEIETQPLYPLVDHVFKGESDFLFREFVENLFERNDRPSTKIISGPLPDIKKIVLPYDEYTEEDLRQRTLYVEASRGCPYKCEYCLSSLDVSVRNFETTAFLNELQKLIDRGARQFKFVDRTFNLSPTTSTQILQFFLNQIDLGLFLHFEMVPDRLPDDLKELIKKFPKGSLQFEIGIQTWNPLVARNVSRRQNYEKINENLRFLKQETGVHTHADLIVGLPGENWQSFADGFDALSSLEPDEVQVGILKRLKGTPIVRHDTQFQMQYSEKTPFQIISNKDLTHDEIERLEIFADFWDHVANSGRFQPVMKILKEKAEGGSLFNVMYDFSQQLFKHFGRTHSIHLKDLQEKVYDLAGIPELTPEVNRRVSQKIPARQAHHLGQTR